MGKTNHKDFQAKLRFGGHRAFQSSVVSVNLASKDSYTGDSYTGRHLLLCWGSNEVRIAFTFQN